MKLIIASTPNYHVSLDGVTEFENIILSDTSHTTIAVQSNRFVSEKLYSLWRKTNNFLADSRLPARLNSLLKIPWKGNSRFFSILMGPDFQKCFPYFLFPGRKSIYLFDAWPNQHETIRRFVSSLDIDHVFISSSQAAVAMQSIVGKSGFYWVPEGINPQLYRQYPYANKDIDVLAMGRKYDAYHELIVAALATDRKTYLYEKIKGTIIFPTREGFIDGLARTKISICVPSSITHPQRSGNIETMTVRYLQSMISKCLVLGHAPQEMIGLFGYNPVIEIDMQDPVRQICSLLNQFTEYIPLIEKNFITVVEGHTWHHRWKKIIGILS